MSEWNEKRLEMELDGLLEDLPEQEDLEAKINHSINKRIKKIVFSSLLLVTVSVLIILIGINPILNAKYFNPYQLNQGSDEKMLGVVRDYFEVTRPYEEVVSLNVDKEGFGCYHIGMQVVKKTGPIHIGKQNVWVELNRGKYENYMDVDSYFSPSSNRFDFEDVSEEVMIKRISELPESSKIYMSVSDNNPKTFNELTTLPVKVEWLQVYQPNVDFQGGISTWMCCGNPDDSPREEMNENKILDIYLSNLTNLSENKDVWSQWMLPDGSSRIYTDSAIDDTLADAMKLTEISSKNYSVSGKRDEVIEYLKTADLNSIMVDEVNLWE